MDQRRKMGFWRKWYLYSSPFLSIFLLGAMYLPHEYEESRAKCIAALVVFVPFWLFGFFCIAPELDGEGRG